MTTDSLASNRPLTAVDVKALRNADDVTFHYIVGEQSIVRGHKRARSNGGWNRDDATYDVAVAAYFTAYKSAYTGESEFKYAFASVSGQFDDVWQTIAGLLKPGDELTLEWVADNNSQTIEKASLHSDELRLHVKRTSLKHALVFVVDTSICPDNSARMVRRNRWGG